MKKSHKHTQLVAPAVQFNNRSCFFLLAVLIFSTVKTNAQDKIVLAPVSTTLNIGESIGYKSHTKTDYQNDGIYDYEQVKAYNERDIEYKSYVKRADTLFSSGTIRFDQNYNVVNRKWWESRKGEPYRQWDLRYNEKGLLISEYWDGNGDNIYERGFVYSYDQNGNRTAMRYDKNADGTFDDVTLYEFDTESKLIKEVYTRNFPTGITTTKSYAYDTKGRKILFTEDRETDGTVDKTNKWAYGIYDNLIYTYYDNDGDGIGESIQTKEYDAFGNLLFAAYTSGTTKRYFYYTYSGTNKVLEVKQDDDGDSTLDQTTVYSYDAKDSLSAIEVDTDLDGTVDYLTTYEYDANGKLTKTESDNKVDGILEGYDYYTYDAAGNILLWDSYVSEPAFRNDSVRVYYTYDNQNRIITQYRHDYGISGFKNYYNNVGEKIKVEYDFDGDAIFDQKDTMYISRTSSCDILGTGLSHNIQVEIPYRGRWQFDLCGSTFSNAMSLSKTGECDTSIFFATDGCSSNDASVEVTLDSGTYYLTIAGQAESDTGNYNLNISLLEKLGVHIFTKSTFTTYPNPANDYLKSEKFIYNQLTISDAFGRRVLTISNATEQIDISTLSSGLYTVTIQSHGDISTSKFLKL